MDFIVEMIMSLAFEGTMELSTCRKIPNWIRYPLIVLIGLFFAAVIGLILLIGLWMLHDAWYFGVLFIGLSVFLTCCMVWKFRRVYILNQDTWN